MRRTLFLLCLISVAIYIKSDATDDIINTCDFINDTDNCFNLVFGSLDPIDTSFPVIEDANFTIDYTEFEIEKAQLQIDVQQLIDSSGAIDIEIQ